MRYQLKNVIKGLPTMFRNGQPNEIGELLRVVKSLEERHREKIIEGKIEDIETQRVDNERRIKMIRLENKRLYRQQYNLRKKPTVRKNIDQFLAKRKRTPKKSPF